MARNIQNLNNTIIDLNGQVLKIETRNEDFKENKYFAVAAMCGHAGLGFFVPIIFPIASKSKHSAIEIIKAMPRVKNKASNFVLGINEIALAEYYFLSFINDCDQFLISTQPVPDLRKVLLPSYANVITKHNRGNKLTTKEKLMLENIESKNIFFSEDYPSTYVLQKAFAPSLIGDKIVYPNKVDMNILLAKYYTNRIQKLGIEKKNSATLCFCLEIFGFENTLGVSVDVQNNTMSFINQEHQIETFPITEKIKEKIFALKSDRLVNALNKNNLQQVAPETAYVKIPSAIDRFNKRLAKTAMYTPEKSK